MNKTKQFKEGFNAFSGLHEGLVLLKDLSKPSTPSTTYMVKIYLKMGFQCLFGLTRRVGAIERLIQTFDACHNPIFTHRIFSSVGTHGGATRTQHV
jgi:hypothetical protein